MSVDPTMGDFWIGLGLLLIAALLFLGAQYLGALIRWFKRETYGHAASSRHAAVRWNAQWEIANAKVNAVFGVRALAVLVGTVGLAKLLGV